MNKIHIKRLHKNNTAFTVKIIYFLSLHLMKSNKHDATLSEHQTLSKTLL